MKVGESGAQVALEVASQLLAAYVRMTPAAKDSTICWHCRLVVIHERKQPPAGVPAFAGLSVDESYAEA